MTQPPESSLPPFGTPAYQPPPQPPKEQGRTLDLVLSWIVYALQVVVAIVVSIISLFTIFLTDSCGNIVGNESDVCNPGYFSAVLYGYWIALLVMVVVVPIGLIVAGVRHTAGWPWAVGGLVGTGVASLAFFILVSR